MGSRGPRPGDKAYVWIKETSTIEQCDLIGSSDGGVTECLWLVDGISRVLLRSRCVACRPACASCRRLLGQLVPKGASSATSRRRKEATASPPAPASSPAAPAPAAGCCDFSPPTLPAAFGFYCLIRQRYNPKSLKFRSHPLYRWGAEPLDVEWLAARRDCRKTSPNFLQLINVV